MCLQSVIAKQRLLELGNKGYIPAFMNFSAQTNSNRTQEIIENKLEKKRKNILGRSLYDSVNVNAIPTRYVFQL